MKIKLPIRFLSVKNDKESKEKRELNRLIGNEEEESIEDLVKYEYRSFVCDSFDIKSFVEYDEDHTTVGLTGGDFYVIKVKFPIFEAFYSFVNGTEVKDIDSFNFTQK